MNAGFTVHCRWPSSNPQKPNEALRAQWIEPTGRFVFEIGAIMTAHIWVVNIFFAAIFAVIALIPLRVLTHWPF